MIFYLVLIYLMAVVPYHFFFHITSPTNIYHKFLDFLFWSKLFDHSLRYLLEHLFHRDVQANTSNYDQITYSKRKSPETYDRYWWWMVYGGSAKVISPLRIPKLSKKHKRRRMKFKKNYMKLISGGMIGNSNYIGTRLNGWIQNLSLKGNNPIQFFKNVLFK